MADVTLHLPIAVSGYTDFYSSKEARHQCRRHVPRQGQCVQPNWLHMPIGYNGRASTVVVSGTKVRRPRGQLKPPTRCAEFRALQAARFRTRNGRRGRTGRHAIGEMLTEKQAERMIFGFRHPQRLERARHPAMGVCAARAVPGQGSLHVDQPRGS
jgi:fumarylacetoacetase